MLVATLVLAALCGVAMLVMRVTKQGEAQAEQQLEGGVQQVMHALNSSCVHQVIAAV